MGDGVVFLMYHELETAGRPLCEEGAGYARYVVGAEDFKQHLSHLRSGGLRGVPVGEALKNDGGDAVAHRVCITFDDGCETDLLFAAPALEDAGFGATFYVTVGHLNRRGYMSESQLHELSDAGFDIGSHSLTHSYLHDLEDGRVREEVAGSKERLEQLTGRRVAHFSCPGGRWDSRVARLAREAGYESVATSAVGVNTRATDPFRLSRVAVTRGTTVQEVLRVSRGEGLAARRARVAVLDVAKRVLGNSIYERLRTAALGGE
ncbi:MAG TPA: polysaccharide deacetylase family protein [Pyrinomonadaceae bacterium]|nr:polysaccharide deacetylase family protein [Pyrinomonadaceae bacterium]